MGGGEISWAQAYERRMRRFNLEVILTALIALMILTAGLFFAWEAFHNSALLLHHEMTCVGTPSGAPQSSGDLSGVEAVGLPGVVLTKAPM